MKSIAINTLKVPGTVLPRPLKDITVLQKIDSQTPETERKWPGAVKSITLMFIQQQTKN